MYILIMNEFFSICMIAGHILEAKIVPQKLTLWKLPSFISYLLVFIQEVYNFFTLIIASESLLEAGCSISSIQNT